jgi:hypothetical protein
MIVSLGRSSDSLIGGYTGFVLIASIGFLPIKQSDKQYGLGHQSLSTVTRNKQYDSFVRLSGKSGPSLLTLLNCVNLPLAIFAICSPNSNFSLSIDDIGPIGPFTYSLLSTVSAY